MLELIRKKSQIVKKTEEYFNSIRTNIQFSNEDFKVLTVTSVQSGEGKSTTSISLAISFANIGLKTLLIDADTRNSVMSDTFKSSQRYRGLTSYLSGNSKLSDVIHETSIDNLNIIPAGHVPQNPTVLLQHDNFQNMMDSVRKDYDYIIIDTPSIGLVADAAIVAHSSDASMIVTKSGVVKRQLLVKAKEQLGKSGSVFLGVVLNRVEEIADNQISYAGYRNSDDKSTKNRRTEKRRNVRRL